MYFLCPDENSSASLFTFFGFLPQLRPHNESYSSGLPTFPTTVDDDDMMDLFPLAKGLESGYNADLNACTSICVQFVVSHQNCSDGYNKLKARNYAQEGSPLFN